LFGDGILSDELLHLVDRKPSAASRVYPCLPLLLMEAERGLTVREVCARMGDRMPAVLERHKDRSLL